MAPLGRLAATEPAKQALTLYEEFKQFAFKGNVIELAVGVIVGTAFARLVDALVKNLLLPLVGVLLPGEQGYRDWKWVINGQEVPYGLFLAEVINFLIVALVLFLFIIKFMGWLLRAKREEAPPPPTKEQELLTEIRDLMKKERA